MITRKLLVSALATLGLATDALAVRLEPDGIGQALIFPYFTVQNSDGSNSWNTYLSVANPTPDAKVVRVRFREGRAGKDIGNLNLFLSPNDLWTGAIVPSSAQSSSVAMIITLDSSCTDPPLPSAGETFTNVLYSGARDDGLGTGLDRTREGYVELIEMASLTGVTATAVTHVNGFPDDCSMVRAKPALPPADVRPPSGGLSGTLTLINVNSGLDLGMNAIALAELSSQPFFRPPSDTYAGFSAQEIRPVSTVRAGGREYDLRWKNGVDAVSSVFMASELINEFVLEPGTASQTDWVITFPTRPYLQPGASPFQPNISFDQRDIFDREGNGVHHSMTGLCLPGFPCPLAVLDHAASAAFPVGHQAGPSSLLGSVIGVDLGLIPDSFTAGWMRLRVADRLPGFGQLGSEPGSTMTDLATGAVTVGRFELFGLPMTGFMVRTFRNGTLRCITNAGLQTGCQGNYAGSFPHRYVRTITQVP